MRPEGISPSFVTQRVLTRSCRVALLPRGLPRFMTFAMPFVVPV